MEWLRNKLCCMNKVFLCLHHQVYYITLQNEMKIEIVTYRNFPLCKLSLNEVETYFCLKSILLLGFGQYIKLQLYKVNMAI